MNLRDGEIYRTPDGKQFMAHAEPHREDAEPGWIFVPIDMKDDDDASFRDRLQRFLFLERGKIICLAFETPEIVRDTGWTVDDLEEE